MSKQPLSNPYAKRKTASSSAPSRSHTQAQRPPPLPLPPTGPQTSFSQAFESIEDTSHYQDQIKNNQRNDPAARERSAQRAFEAAQIEEAASHRASATTSTSPPDAASEGGRNVPTTDRDHHVLLQPHVLYVSTKQRGNAILTYIRNVPYAFSRMVPDYIFSATRCALFLSCKYHSLYPNYIHRRISELRTDFSLRVLLVLVDVQDNATTLLQLNKLCVTSNLTLVMAWSEVEAARYLETYKAMDGKDASIIQKKEQLLFGDQVADFLTAHRSVAVHKNDCQALLGQFGSLRAVVAADAADLAMVAGMGPIKVKRLHDALHKPFSSRSRREREKKRKLSAAEADVLLKNDENGIKDDKEEELAIAAESEEEFQL